MSLSLLLRCKSLVLVLALIFVSVSAFQMPASRLSPSLSRRLPSARSLFGTSRPNKPSSSSSSPSGPQGSPANLGDAFKGFGDLPGMGGAGGMGGLGGLMEGVKKAQEMMTQMAAMEERMKEVVVTHNDPQGGLTVSFKAVGAPVSVSVSEELRSSLSAEELSQRLTLAVKAAHELALSAMKESVEKIFADAGMPNDPAIMNRFKQALGQ